MPRSRPLIVGLLAAGCCLLLVVPMAAHGTTAETATSAAAHSPNPQATATALRQPGWLSKHCPIAVTVDVSAGRTTGHKSGVSLQGVKTEEPVAGFLEPAVQYTWQLSRQDKFCGIVGSQNGSPVVSSSLKPNVSTAHGGSYTDWSPNGPDQSSQYPKFTVYAKKVAARRHRSSPA